MSTTLEDTSVVGKPTVAEATAGEAIRRIYGKGPVTERSMPLWCVRNKLSDPFGAPIFTPPLSAVGAVTLICQAAQKGWIENTSAHDCDIVPWDPENPEDDLDETSETYKTLVTIRDMLRKAGVGFHTITCNLHAHPLFAQGGLTNPDPKIRLLAKQKVFRAIRIGAFLGARKFTYWVARDGWTVAVKTDFNQVYKWIAEGLNDAHDYITARGYKSYQGGTIEPKPNEPNPHCFIPTSGHAVGFILAKLEEPWWWGVNPELLQHEGMTLLDAVTCVALLVDLGKLSFLHFGNQVKGQYDDDFPPLVGPEGLKETATMFWVLERAGWKGVVEYDCHMLRSEGDSDQMESCVLKFIENCSRGLAIALILASRLQGASKALEGLAESEADLTATAEMCGLSKVVVDQMMESGKAA